MAQDKVAAKTSGATSNKGKRPHSIRIFTRDDYVLASRQTMNTPSGHIVMESSPRKKKNETNGSGALSAFKVMP